LNAPAPAIGE
jgi:hypothetical protein